MLQRNRFQDQPSWLDSIFLNMYTRVSPRCCTSWKLCRHQLLSLSLSLFHRWLFLWEILSYYFFYYLKMSKTQFHPNSVQFFLSNNFSSNHFKSSCKTFRILPHALPCPHCVFWSGGISAKINTGSLYSSSQFSTAWEILLAKLNDRGRQKS